MKNTSHRFTLSLYLCLLVAGSTMRADDASQALLARVVLASKSTQTLQANIILTRLNAGKASRQATGSVVLMKPNLALIKFSGNDEAVPTELASDGNTLFSFASINTYSKEAIDTHATQISEPWWAIPVRYFFTQSYAVFTGVPDPAATSAMLPNETLSGETFRVIAVQGTQPFPYTQKLYINSHDLLQRTVVNFGPSTVFSAEFTNVRLNAPRKAASFRFTPPATAALKQDDPLATMLALNTVAPAFQLPTLTGDTLSLASASRGTKATLINFWYLDCPPCRIEFPDLQKLFTELHTQGFTIVAINRGDSPKPIATYVKQAGLTFPVLLGGDMTPTSIFTTYKAKAFPVTYLLDSDGKIVYRAAGEDLAGLRQALQKLGFNLKP